MLTEISRRTLARLARPNSGVACATLAAALCATGSVLFKMVPRFYRQRLWSSWSAPDWHAAWVTLLLAVVVVWCMHAVLFLREAVGARVERPTNGRWRFGLATAQLGLALALGTYVCAVIRPPEEEFVVTEQGTDIHGEFYRALRVEASSRERSSPRPTVVWLERRRGAVSEQFRVVRGSYWTLATGTHQVAVARATMTADGAFLRHGRQQVALSVARPWKNGLETLLLQGFRRHHGQNQGTSVSHAEVKISNEQKALPLDPEWAGENAFLGLKESPVFLLRAHRSLGAPLAFIAAALALAGVMLRWGLARGASRAKQ